MNWLSYIFPQTIARLSSAYNRDIRINEEQGRYKLLVNGARESGAYIEDLWRFAFFRLGVSHRSLGNVLVLGVAGGTVIHILGAMHPKARIIGVDIDHVMIDVGRRYFSLGEIPGLRLICADARIFVKAHKGPRFDLIIIDLFIGPNIPDVVISEPFQKDVQKILAQNGSVMINYLRQSGYETKAGTLQKILKKLYSSVCSIDRYNNRFFLAQ